jgi:hypothetical protein
MYENRSWHTYSYALAFLWKNRCDTKIPASGLILVSHSGFLENHVSQSLCMAAALIIFLEVGQLP